MKNKLTIGIIISIAVILISVGIGLILKFDKTVEKEKSVPKTSHQVSLKDSPGFRIDSVPYNGGNELALFITSDKDYPSVDIEMTFLDSRRQIISTYKATNSLVSAQRQFVVSTVVDAVKVKSIEVKIVPKKQDENITDTGTIKLDSSKLDFKTIVDDNKGAINLKAINPYNQVINLVNGYVLLYDSDILVDTIFFSSINIKEGGEVSVSVNTNLHDTTGDFKYNKVKVIVNELF